MKNDFTEALLAALPEGRARLAAVAVLAQYAGSTIYLPTEPEKPRRVRAAANMLANGMRPSEAAEALRERFRISTRTAIRDVNEARNMSVKSGANAE